MQIIPGGITTRAALISTLILLGTHTFPALAADTAEEIIVISSRVPLPSSQVGTSVSVLNEDDILAHGNISLVDVLRQQPSISSGSAGGSGQTTSMRIRGEEGFRTLVILDGMRLVDASSPQVTGHVEHLLSEGIERVEVLRGPQGLSYGADAGGVVNIDSRKNSDGLHAGLAAQAGDLGVRQLSGHVGAGNDAGDFQASVTNFETDGFNARTDDTELADSDGYTNTTLHLKAGINVSESIRLEAVHRVTRGEAQYDGCGFPTSHDCLAEFDQQATRFALVYNGARFTQNLAYSQSETQRDYFSDAMPAFSGAGELKRVEYTGSLRHLPGFDLVFGADHEQAINESMTRDNTGFFVEYLSTFSDSLYLTAGLRHDDNEDFGNNTSYRFSIARLYELAGDDQLKIRASMGTGFRAPSPYEITYNAGPFAYPPASLLSLKQETSSGYEIGIAYESDVLFTAEAVYFYQDVEDAIEFDLSGFSGYVQETGTSTSTGIELIGEVALSSTLALKGNYTYNDAERPDGTQRLRRPRHLLNLGAGWSLMQSRLDINLWMRASRDAVDDVSPLDDFEVVDVSMRFQLTRNLGLNVRLENLLDEDYQEVLAYNSPGRGVYFGFRLGSSF